MGARTDMARAGRGARARAECEEVPQDLFEWNLVCLRALGFGRFLRPRDEPPTRTKYEYAYDTSNFSPGYVAWHTPALLVMAWVPGSELWGLVQCAGAGDSERLINSLMFFVYQAIMLTKFIWYFVRGRDMRLLAYLLEVEAQRYAGGGSGERVRRAVRLTRRVLLAGYALVVLTVATACAAALTSTAGGTNAQHNTTALLGPVGWVEQTETGKARPREHDLPFVMPVPFPVDSDALFALAFLLQAVPVCMFGMMFFAADLFIFSCMVHLATQFRVLQDSLAVIDRVALQDLLPYAPEKLGGREELEALLQSGAVEPQRLQRRLEYHLLHCVQHHQLLLLSCNLLESTYSAGFFAHFINGIVAVVLGITAMNANDVIDVGKLLVFWYLSTTLLNLATLCWAGNEVTHQSVCVAGAVLHSGWDVCGPSWRRTAVMLTLRAQRPVYLTAGKFIILSLGSFINTLKAAYSYNTMLSRAAK